MSINWTQIIITLISIIGSVVVGYLVPAIKKMITENTTVKQREYIYTLARSAVYFAEQVMKTSAGVEKKTYVTEWLSEKLGGDVYDAFEDEIDKIIEELVFEMKQLVG